MLAVMAPSLTALLEDLATIQGDLRALLSELPEGAWELPTPSPGWTVRHQVRHLAHGEELGRLAASDPDGFAAELGRLITDLDAVERATVDPVLEPTEELQARWWDAAEGLRAAVAEGAAVITQQANKAYYEKAFATPARIAPDLLAKSGRKASVIGVADKHVLSDGTRTVELHKLRDAQHSDTYLMVWLPKERLLMEADAYTPAPPNSAAPAQPSPSHLNLVDNIQRLKLDVERILPLHGRIVPMGELYRMVGKGV